MSIEKVAEKAGVSTSTVSRVINNHPRVAPETARAVRAAMAELAYTPSDRRPGPKPSSRQPEVRSIGFLMLGTSNGNTNPGFFDLLRGISRGAGDRQHKLIFATTTELDQVPMQFRDQPLDGVLLHGRPPRGELKKFLSQTPTVWVMGNRERPLHCDHVMPDALDVGEISAGYLADRGHRHVCFLNLDAGHWALAGYGQCFAGSAIRAGLKPVILERTRREMPGTPSRFDPAVVADLAREVANLPQAPTGIFIADAMQSAIVQPALTQAGITIGQAGVDVITCNNEEPFLLGLHPRPAVIDIHIETIGYRGVERLMRRIENRQEFGHVTVMIRPTLLTSE